MDTQKKKGQKMLSLLVFIVLQGLIIVHAGFSNHDDIRTGLVEMITTGSIFNSSTIPPRYNISYDTPIAGTSYIAIGIVGFQAPNTNDFSPVVTIQSFTISVVQLSIRVYGDTILKLLNVNYIAVGPSVDFLQIQNQNNCFLCTILNSGNDTRIQTRTATTKFVATNLSSQVYLSGFRLHNSEGINNYLQAISSISSGSRTINLSFKTSENNTVTSICFATIVYYHDITQIDFYDYVNMASNALSNTTNPSSITLPNKYHNSNRRFFGISGFNVSRATNRLFSVVTSNNNPNTGYLSNFATYQVIFAHVFIAVRGCNDSNNEYFDVTNENCPVSGSCSAGTYQTNPGRFCYYCHYTCKTCDAAYSNNCTVICESTYFRTLDVNTCPCDSGYVDVGNSIPLCYPCQTLIPGCSTCSSIVLCDTCLTGFTPNANGTCSCTTGFLVTGICIDIVGCISAIEYAGNDQCIACNQTLKFYRTNNFRCQCINGYTLINSVCTSQCGDGIVVTSEQCDDKNNKNGDGCSSLCRIEVGWNCVNTPNPSFCTIIANPVLTLLYVYRNPYANQMEVAIDISPKYAEFSQSKFKSLISHSIPINDFNATYNSQGVLILRFAYSQSIEGKTYNLSLSLDPDYFTSSTATLQIPAIGMNTKLTYDTYYVNNYALEIMVYVLDGLALLVFCFSWISERMIGVQMLQTLQIALFLMPIMGSVPSALGPLQKLKYTNGYNIFSNDDKSRNFTYTFGLSAIGIEKQFLLSFNLMYIILIVTIVASLIMKIVQLLAKKQNEQQEIKKDELAQKKKSLKLKTVVFNIVFERVLFLAGFISMYLIFFAMAVQLSDLQPLYVIVNQQFNLFAAGAAGVILLALITLVIVNAIYPSTNLFTFSFQYRKYTAFYFFYRLAMILSLSFVYTQYWLIYVFMGTTLLSLIICVILRPYPQHIHNAAIAFHEVVVLIVLGTYLFEIIVDSNTGQFEIFFQIAAYMITLLLYVVVVWNAIRLFKWYSYIKKIQYDEVQSETDRREKYPSGKASKIKDQPTDFPSTRMAIDKPLGTQLFGGNNNDNIFSSNDRKKRKEADRLDWTYNQMNQHDETKFETIKKAKSNLLIQDGSLIKQKSRKNLGTDYDRDIKLVIQAPDQVKKTNLQQQSPYDEFGFIKNQSQLHHQEQQEDPLIKIKKRLRKEYNEKVRSSTLHNQEINQDQNGPKQYDQQ